MGIVLARNTNDRSLVWLLMFFIEINALFWFFTCLCLCMCTSQCLGCLAYVSQLELCVRLYLLTTIDALCTNRSNTLWIISCSQEDKWFIWDTHIFQQENKQKPRQQTGIYLVEIFCLFQFLKFKGFFVRPINHRHI